MTRGFAAVAITLLAACGNEGTSVDPDGAVVLDDAGNQIEPDVPWPITSCWLDIEKHPTTGFAELGAGTYEFTRMTDELELTYGTQQGFNVFVNARMSGFSTGNAYDQFDPSNSRMRFRAFYADTNVPLMEKAGCSRTAFKPSAMGGYELTSPLAVIFDTCWRSDRLVGKRIRIDFEITDISGAYASDSKVVTLAPPSYEYPIEFDTPPCPASAATPSPVTPLVKQPTVEIRSGS